MTSGNDNVLHQETFHSSPFMCWSLPAFHLPEPGLSKPSTVVILLVMSPGPKDRPCPGLSPVASDRQTQSINSYRPFQIIVILKYRQNLARIQGELVRRAHFC